MYNYTEAEIHTLRGVFESMLGPGSGQSFPTPTVATSLTYTNLTATDPGGLVKVQKLCTTMVRALSYVYFYYVVCV